MLLLVGVGEKEWCFNKYKNIGNAERLNYQGFYLQYWHVQEGYLKRGIRECQVETLFCKFFSCLCSHLPRNHVLKVHLNANVRETCEHSRLYRQKSLFLHWHGNVINVVLKHSHLLSTHDYAMWRKFCSIMCLCVLQYLGLQVCAWVPDDSIYITD